jgi:hypothetical protein
MISFTGFPLNSAVRERNLQLAVSALVHSGGRGLIDISERGTPQSEADGVLIDNIERGRKGG